MTAFGLHRRRRLLALLLSGTTGVIVACSQGDESSELRWRRDLYPRAQEPNTGAAEKFKVMVAEKTDRVVIRHFNLPLVFEPVDLPTGTRVEFQYRIVAEGGYPNESLGIHVESDDGLDPPRTESFTLPVGDGGWMPFAVEISTGGATKRLAFRFGHVGHAKPRSKVAVLRPHAWLPGAQTTRPEPARRVILITLDTLRPDRLGAYGDPLARTPELDAFADEAVRFDQAFSASNVTNPSHTSIFTSLYPKDHGVLDNFVRLAPDAPTLMQRLRDAGFRTSAFVSSFNFEPDRSDFGKHFDDFSAPSVYFERRAEDVNADVFEWLAEHWQSDFFAWIHYFDAHMPYDPPAPYDAFPLEGEPESVEIRAGTVLEEWMSEEDDLRVYRSRYRGEIAYLDHQLGQLFRYLKRLGVWDSSLIVITADHGESLGEHRIYCDHAGIYDETTAVPLFFKPPDSEHRGARAGLASTLDIYPTLFDYLELPVSDALRGRSLRARIESGSSEGWSEVYSEHAKGAQVSVRTSRHRMILSLQDESIFPRFSIEAGRRELYDVLEDPGEHHDRSESEPELARSLEQRLTAYLEDRRPTTGAVPIDDEEYRRRLEALGYVQ